MHGQTKLGKAKELISLIKEVSKKNGEYKIDYLNSSSSNKLEIESLLKKIFKSTQQENKSIQSEKTKDEILEKDSRFYINSEGEYSFKDDDEDEDQVDN